MSTHGSDPDDLGALLPLYVLGVLAPDEAARVEAALAADPALAAEVAAFHDGLPALVTQVAPPPDILARLQASIGAGPLERFATRIASLFDLTLDRARELLGLTERPASWERPFPGGGLELVHFGGGPAWAAADCGFVRLAPGTPFPLHTHAGEEVSLILAGALLDRLTGQHHGPGDEIVRERGTAHDVISVGPEVCVYAARALDGIEIAGVAMRAPKR